MHAKPYMELQTYAEPTKCRAVAVYYMTKHYTNLNLFYKTKFPFNYTFIF